jgi:hypothetical protein
MVWKDRRAWEKGIFSMLLLFHFHASAVLVADCIYQYGIDRAQQTLDMYAPDYLSQMYRQTAVGQVGLVLLYTLFMVALYLIFKQIGKNIPIMGEFELLFLSVLNVVGIIFTYMVVDLSVVKLEKEVFLLFENRQEIRSAMSYSTIRQGRQSGFIFLLKFSFVIRRQKPSLSLT